jgi:cell wall-associated NlpC family hydrolase
MNTYLHVDPLQDLIGKPYVKGARGPDAFDCWGVCVEVYRRLGVILPDYRAGHLTHAQAAALMANTARDRTDPLPKPELWCFVFDDRIGHMGLFVHARILHCARGLGVVLQRFEQFALMHPHMTFARWRE